MLLPQHQIDTEKKFVGLTEIIETALRLEGFYILMVQQIVSIVFVTDAFIFRRKRPITESKTVETCVSP